jgi:hypothetical protein
VTLTQATESKVHSMSSNGIVRDVEQHGWSAISISDIDPPFIYTVGLMQTFDHPEAILFGLEPKVTHGILANLVSNIRTGKRYVDSGTYDGVLNGYSIGIRPVHESQHEQYLGYAMGFCLRSGHLDLKAVQVYWPDRHGVFPFEPNCDLGVYSRQPRLDVALTPSELEDLDRD